MTDKEFIARYIVNNCIETVPPDNLMYGKLPGDRYQYQYYLSRLLYDVTMRCLICENFMSLVTANIGHWNFQLTGREWSSIPLIIALQDFCYQHDITLNAFMIKRKRKIYGIHNYEEGSPNHLPVLIVDDLCNSTDSFRHCKMVCDGVLNLKTIPFIFAVLNKYNRQVVGEKLEYDKYLGNTHKALYIVDGEDIRNVKSAK